MSNLGTPLANCSDVKSKYAFALRHKSKWAIVALIVGVTAGVVLVALGETHIFGAVGSVAFRASLTTGALLCIAIGAMAGIAIFNCRDQKEVIDSNEPNPRRIVQEELTEEQASMQRILDQQLTEEDHKVLNSLCESLEKKEEISEALSKISKDFFENKSQERSKAMFSMAMRTLLGAAVTFPKAGSLQSPESLSGRLDSNIFRVSISQGVEKAIPNSSHDKKHIHVYQAASQYNASEAPGPFTPSIGGAMVISTGDNTQGPLAQRTNPISFELVTAFLTHLGFNMLDAALPSAGKTYEDSLIKHGYLRPTDDTIESLTDEFKNKFADAEYVCYSSLDSSWGGLQPVYILLQAAPAIGYARQLKSSSDELQKYAALANYLALFRYGIHLAKHTRRSVVLHATTVGGGVFRNKTENLQWGFEKAALALQAEMKRVRVFVQLEAFGKDGNEEEIGTHLKIKSKARIGDP